MYCMKCGEKVPDNASFCPFCGSPLEDPQNDNLKFVSAICPNCGASLNVDQKAEKAICKYCGTEFLVSEGVHKYNEVNGNYGTIYQGKTVNVTNINKHTKSIFDSLKEREQIKLEREKIEAEKQKAISEQDSKDLPWLILLSIICFGAVIIMLVLMKI